MKIENQKLKVLLYTDADVFAGTERHMLDLATGLRALGVDVTIACPRPGALADRADQAKLPMLCIHKTGNIDHEAIRTLVKCLAQGTSIIHAHNGRTHIAAAEAVRKARRGICITTQHFLAPARTTRTGLKKLIAHYLHRRAAKYTAHTIAISDSVRNAALARGDDLPQKITTIHNGSSEPCVIRRSSWPIRTTRSELGLSNTTPLILCAARLQAEKDIPTLLRAMPAVLATQPDARCLIAGKGDQMPAIKILLAQLAKTDPCLNAAVQLLGFRNDIPNLLDACDLFVLPSIAEPFGLVLLEAMALAKPVIATNTGGPPEIVRHNETGLLVPPQDPAALAAAINSLLADSARRATFAGAARQRYLEHFTVDRMARETLKIYQSCLHLR